jgi:DNA-binding HxlR family transcriptional regulator
MQSLATGDFLDLSASEWQALELLADKWGLITLYALASGKRRNGELRRAIKGISQKMLTQTLRQLERNGFVARTVYAVVPPRVEYQLTALGESALHPLQVMCQWAEAHWSEVLAARAAYQEPGDAIE